MRRFVASWALMSRPSVSRSNSAAWRGCHRLSGGSVGGREAGPDASLRRILGKRVPDGVRPSHTHTHTSVL